MGAAWRGADGEIYAEVSLDEAQRDEAERFAVHPALLDSAGHVLLLDRTESLRLPFSFSGIWVGEGLAATDLRVRARLSDERAEIAIADLQGRPVCAVEGLSLREVDRASLRGGEGAGEKDLYGLRWDPVPAAEASTREIEQYRLSGLAEGEDTLTAARRLAGEALAAIQAYLADEESARHLAILTEGAVAAAAGEAPHPALAAAWGLVRSAQAENPGRFVLIDLDGDASEAELSAALAVEGEAALALREGKLLAPRLARVSAQEGSASSPLDPERTILITGGLSGLGALAARHLAERHGAKQMLLVGRRGIDTPGAGELLSELAAIGCEAKAAACDVSDKEQLEALLDSIGTEHPLGAVIHCAGVVDDALIADQSPEHIDRALAPKADAAWHLHELTREADLSHFVLYSSIAGSLESLGQANYSAANVFLDALARERRAEGLVATAIGWGPWEEGMAADLGRAGSTRREGLGIGDLGPEEGFELLDLILARGEPVLVASRFLPAGLRRQARASVLSPLLSGLISTDQKLGAREGSLARTLARVSEKERFDAMLEFVREEVAGILGRPSAESIVPDEAFKDMGFDSLGAVELRKRLALETGVRLEATIVFDYPTSTGIAGYLLERMDLSPVAEGDPEQDEIRRLLEAIPPARLREAGVLETLQSLSGAASVGDGSNSGTSDIDAMGVDELVKRTLEEPVTQETER
jgi:NAD(P)-dependent dehydrogenase (short-subunit alcohol dehydrogenase family)/acyl carrier protein